MISLIRPEKIQQKQDKMRKSQQTFKQYLLREPYHYIYASNQGSKWFYSTAYTNTAFTSVTKMTK